jgi:hypothetical protein
MTHIEDDGRWLASVRDNFRVALRALLAADPVNGAAWAATELQIQAQLAEKTQESPEAA